MAHYALINSDNIVVKVIVGQEENTTAPEGFTDWEAYYADWYGLTCKRTSYNTKDGVHANGGTPLRKNYAGRDMIYDPDEDIFYYPKPHPSWTLNSDFEWEPPIPYPSGDLTYMWDESWYQEDNTQGWTPINEA